MVSTSALHLSSSNLQGHHNQGLLRGQIQDLERGASTPSRHFKRPEREK